CSACRNRLRPTWPRRPPPIDPPQPHAPFAILPARFPRSPTPMNLRPALLALAVTATLAACGKKEADTAAVPAAAPAAAPAAPVKAPEPLARFRGKAVMGKDGWGLTVC